MFLFVAWLKVAAMAFNYYDTYRLFKRWYEPPDDSHDLFYRMETADFGLRQGSKIVELGFGEGRFLDFAKRAGYEKIHFVPPAIKAKIKQ